ncbi:MAG: lipopolysaccharide biosynthesis protein [Nocardioides sp.]
MTTDPPNALRTSSALGVGSLVSGLLAYVFFALVTRALGATDAAPVAVLWAWWGFAGAGLTFPLQHWITRSVAVHGGEGAVRRAMPAVAGMVLGLAVVVTLVSWFARDVLFREDGLTFPLLAGAVTLGSGLMGIDRGMLTARRRFTAVGAGLIAENAVRCLAAGVLITTGNDSPAAYGACLVAGYVAAAFWPSALRVADSGVTLTTDRPLAFLSGASAGQMLSQGVLTGGPVLLAAASGAPAEVTALFAALALFRAPYTLALGLVSQLTERLTRLVVTEDRAALRRFNLGVLGATIAAVALAWVIGTTVGPPLMELVFGHGVRLSDGLTAVVAVGSAFALANLVLTVSVMAHAWPHAVVAAWLGALVPGGVLFLMGDLGGSALEATCAAFVATEAVAFLELSAISAALPGRQEHRRAER